MGGGDRLWSEHHKVKSTESARQGTGQRDMSGREATQGFIFCKRRVQVKKLTGGGKIRTVETYSLGCAHAASRPLPEDYA
jgi:hypothetical protein